LPTTATTTEQSDALIVERHERRLEELVDQDRFPPRRTSAAPSESMRRTGFDGD